MTLSEEIITIGMCVLATLLTRFLPFIVFSEKKKTPKFIEYLGKEYIQFTELGAHLGKVDTPFNDILAGGNHLCRLQFVQLLDKSRTADEYLSATARIACKCRSH